MSPRPYWKGYLKLSLVSCPIAVHAACSSAERISFRQINRKTGNRLRQQLIDEETREVVEAHEKARGYEIGKGQFLLIEDEELEAIEIASTHTIDIDSFVPRAEIDQRFFDAPYYITPNDPVGQDAFAVIREAMRSKALVALGRVVLSKRERVMALEPYDKGLIGTTLRYPYEVRHATDYFDEIPDLTPAPELLRLAAHILDSKTATSSRRPSATAMRRPCWRTLRPSRPACRRSPSKALPCPAGPSISSRRCGGASPRRRRDRQPHARLPPSRPANGRECQNLPHQCTGTAAGHSRGRGGPNPQFPSEEANHDRSDRPAHALRRLHPQIDRA